MREKMAGGRGPSWRRAEILDLLGIWGKEKVQAALRESHRNIDVFEDVAQKMRERGHQKTAEECRSKSKCLRRAYKQVLSHNDKLGNQRITCPFYEELERILQGDPSVKRRHASQSLGRETTTRQRAKEEGTLGLFTFNTQERNTMEEGDVLETETTSNDAGQEEHSSQEDSDATMISEAPREDVNLPSSSTEIGEESHGRIQRRDPDAIPPGVALSDLSPSSRLALKRKKRERISAIQRVGEQMLQQSSREHREMMEAFWGTTEKLMEEMRASREVERWGTERICDLFREAIGVIRDMPNQFQRTWDLVHP